MPEEGGAQAPALSDRVSSGQRQEPRFARRVKVSHLPEHGIKVAEDLIAAAPGGHLPGRCFIGPDAGGQPQGGRGEILQSLRRAVIEGPPALGRGDLRPVSGVLIRVRPGPPHDRVGSEREGERGDPAAPVRRPDDLN
jgi:hypothetical protein